MELENIATTVIGYLSPLMSDVIDPLKTGLSLKIRGKINELLGIVNGQEDLHEALDQFENDPNNEALTKNLQLKIKDQLLRDDRFLSKVDSITKDIDYQQTPEERIYFNTRIKHVEKQIQIGTISGGTTTFNL